MDTKIANTFKSNAKKIKKKHGKMAYHKYERRVNKAVRLRKSER